MPRAISPGPAGLKFWRAPGLSADNTVEIDNLPASIGNQFNPWGPKRPVQDWACSNLCLFGVIVTPPDTDNLPAGVADSFYPWGPRRGNPYWTWFSALHIPVTLTATGGSYTLTGGDAVSLAFGQAAAAGSYALTGSAAGQAFGYATGSGSYALTGSAAALALGHVAGAGSYTITGTDAGLVIPGGIAAAAGSYTLTGSDAALTVSGGVDYLPAGMTGGYVPWRRPFPINLRTSTGRPLSTGPTSVVLTAAGGSYVITGSAVSFVVASPPDTTNLPAGAVNWFNPWRRPFPINLRTSTGRPLAVGPVTLTAAAGSYTLTGTPVALALGLSCNSGSYTVSGTAAVLARGFAAGAGAYAITGTDANLVQAGSITLTCEAGSYTLTGGTDVSFLGVIPPTVEQPGGGYAGRVSGASRGRMIRRRKRGELDLPPDLEPPPLSPSPPDLPPPAPGPKPPDLLPPQPGLMADMAMPQSKPLPPHVDEDEDEIALLLGLIS